MSSSKDIDLFAALTFILSLIGLILLIIGPFATFYLPGYGARYSCLTGCEYYTSGDLTLQILTLVFLILIIVLSLNDLLPNKFIDKDLTKLTMVLSLIVIIFTAAGLASFGAEYGDYEWEPGLGFYGGIVAGLLIMILLVIKDRYE